MPLVNPPISGDGLSEEQVTAIVQNAVSAAPHLSTEEVQSIIDTKISEIPATGGGATPIAQHVLSSAAGKMEVTGLNLTPDKLYKFSVYIPNVDSGGTEIYIRSNGDNDDSHYVGSRNTQTTNTQGANSWWFSGGEDFSPRVDTNTGIASAMGLIVVRNGDINRTEISFEWSSPKVTGYATFTTATYTFTPGAITSLSVVSSWGAAYGMFAAGSKLSVYEA